MTIWVPEEVEERERREKRSANCIMDKQYNNNSDGGSSSLQLFFIVYAIYCIIIHIYIYTLHATSQVLSKLKAAAAFIDFSKIPISHRRKHQLNPPCQVGLGPFTRKQLPLPPKGDIA